MAAHSVRWSVLPDPVAQRIVRQAFANGGSSVRDWVTLSLVCKCAHSARTRCCKRRCCGSACAVHVCRDASMLQRAEFTL